MWFVFVIAENFQTKLTDYKRNFERSKAKVCQIHI